MASEPTPSQVRRARVGVAVFVVLALAALVGAVLASGPNRGFWVLGAGLAGSMAAVGAAGPWFKPSQK